jgi:hypothetical protein
MEKLKEARSKTNRVAGGGEELILPQLNKQRNIQAPNAQQHPGRMMRPPREIDTNRSHINRDLDFIDEPLSAPIDSRTGKMGKLQKLRMSNHTSSSMHK